MYELNIVIDLDGEPSDTLIEMMRGIVANINEKTPQLEARLEVWEPATLDEVVAV